MEENNAVTDIIKFINDNDIHGLIKYFGDHQIKPSFFKKNTNIIISLINANKNNFLKVIFNSIKYDNKFILNLLNFYKNKNITSYKFNYLIAQENNKIVITNEMYEHAFKQNNFMALKILFENDINTNKKDALKKINKYELVKNSVKTNDYHYVEKILSFKNFNYKISRYEDILIEAIKNNEASNSIFSNEKNIAKLLIHTSLKPPYSDCSYKILLLNIAIKSQNLDIVQYLIENEEFQYTSEELNSKDLKGEYPIIVALSNKIEIFDYLLEKGIDYNSKNNNEVPLIFLAIYLKNIDAVYSLVNDQTHDKISIDILDKNGYTPLIYSYINNLHEIFNHLLEYSDINHKDNYNHDILHYVIQNNDSCTLKKLINIGAKISEDNIKASIGNSIMSTILDYDNIPLNYINEKGQSILIETIVRGWCPEKCAEKLIEKGCNVNVQDKDGNTPLIYATKRHNIDLVSLLIKYGAIKDMKNKDDKKAVDYIECNKNCRYYDSCNLCIHRKLRRQFSLYY